MSEQQAIHLCRWQYLQAGKTSYAATAEAKLTVSALGPEKALEVAKRYRETFGNFLPFAN